MSDVVLKVEGLTKKYTIGENRERYVALRDVLVRKVRRSVKKLGAIWGNGSRESTPPDNEIYALKDVSFEVRQGEVVGIIGRNGAGKSTLLKILSRITEPTEGRVRIRGRVASLLEVGTGFHPELTGRENIFLNGAILGMTRQEIRRKFDEIVAFAEVEKFIDTPVKHYSSGMYVRLAFAVAAHLEPEILLVDEVLAVGDAEFQKKCLGKMRDVSERGRTVLFVSHNLAAVTHLCDSGMVLEYGKVAFQGEAGLAVAHYRAGFRAGRDSKAGRASHVIFDAAETGDEGDFAVTRLELLDTSGRPKDVVLTWDDIVFRIWYTCRRPLRAGSVVMEISSFEGSRLLLLSTRPDGSLPLEFEPGLHAVECVVEKLPLSAGDYSVGAALAMPNVEYLWRHEHLGTLAVAARDVYRSGLAPTATRCLLAVHHEWRVVR